MFSKSSDTRLKKYKKHWKQNFNHNLQDNKNNLIED